MTNPEDDTVGGLVDRTAAAAPGSIHWRDWTLTYLGEVQLDQWLTVPFGELQPLDTRPPELWIDLLHDAVGGDW